MQNLEQMFREDSDAIDRLPLSILPIKTKGLGDACLVKNHELEGVIELFSDDRAGSGQIRTNKLPEIFSFDKGNERDLDIISELSALPSFDVYSLRVELRGLGIDVDEQKYLRLSQDKADELATYMQIFTRPLVSAVYGQQDTQGENFGEILKMLSEPQVEMARQNLMIMSDSFGIKLGEIPLFLEEYGDTYLSLAYYTHLISLNFSGEISSHIS